MPYTYEAPLRDMRFAIDRVLEAPSSWRTCPAFADIDADTAWAVLEEAARFATGVLQPINAGGDREGCRLDADGRVRTPAGFREAYRAFVDGGWPALPCAPEWGGQGLPLLLDAAVREMLDACNHGWTMYPDLLHGAYETIKAHADEGLKARYLPKLASGEWLAAMALTEPQAGSDLGLLHAHAVTDPDGSVRVTGQKIFISGADHDLTDNVVHLVLCRLPGAPDGSKGISLALVPTVRPDGTRNAVFVDGLEHKMGIHASATCSVHYDQAFGWLVGEPHRGLAAMFLMMNSARLHVGLQGLGHQEMAVQNARRHAAQRVQGGQAIERHPAMRHLLLRGQAMVEGQRLLAYRAALALDEAAHQPDPARRAAEGRIAALLTPVVKAFCTEHGFRSASEALQVFGGYGYTREFGVEQTLRDARIAMIYEGTNEIQAIDLVQRKLLADRGEALDVLLASFETEAARAAAQPGLSDFADALRREIDAVRTGFRALSTRATESREAVLAVADDALQGIAWACMAWSFAAGARAAANDPDRDWAAAKTARLRYGVQWLLPQATVHWRRVSDRDAVLPAA
jgi:alkylation response protein AidB-like acyl-CoA dehydrogenase